MERGRGGIDPVLVVRSARESVLRDYLRDAPPHVVVLGHPPAPAGAGFLAAPPGPLRWRRFDRSLRHALTTRRWSEIVVLHNMGDQAYAGVFAIAGRIRPTAPLRIFRANGVSEIHPSWFALIARRTPRAALASLAGAALIVVLMPVGLWLTWRRARRAARSTP